MAYYVDSKDSSLRCCCWFYFVYLGFEICQYNPRSNDTDVLVSGMIRANINAEVRRAQNIGPTKLFYLTKCRLVYPKLFRSES